ncbi:uncharacterized protein LOC132259234 [Phlebotomus argentipes]|uniref:uncharacterized protein LOC132259234 n=1 Tax=Phlebotomus argentipes TaxID=94469 RepID=UPI0028929C43|nr:uncharacterized protein LOC132259234 [Phlebotomus argentipes]
MEKDNSGANGDHPEQPRQPSSLQGLLKFAMEATKKEDAPQDSTMEPMNPEDRKFLEEALKSMTVDVCKELTDALKVIMDSSSSESDQVDAIETINHYILSIDQADNFHKIGGFIILKPCLKSPFESVRAETAGLITDLAQNNPYCQQQLIENKMLQELTPLLNQPEPICTRAMSAISAIVTNFQPGMENLFTSGEIDKIVAVLEARKENRLITKITFFLSAIPECHPDFVDKFLDMGIMKYLARHIAPVTGEELENSQVMNKLQNILQATVNFCSHNRARDDLKFAAKDLPARLEDIAKVARSDEAFMEIQESAEKLMQMLK